MPSVINRTPEVVCLRVDRQEDLIQVPLRASLRPPPKLIGRLLPEVQPPLPHRLVRHDDPAFRQQFLAITLAATKTRVQPDGVATDLWGEAMPFVQ